MQMNIHEFLKELMNASTDGQSEILIKTKDGTTMVCKISKKEDNIIIEG